MDEKNLPAKVPQVTLLFWIIKILATILVRPVAMPSRCRGFAKRRPKPEGPAVSSERQSLPPPRLELLWRIIAPDRLASATPAVRRFSDPCSFLASDLALVNWEHIETVNTPKVEIFYWVTIMFSQTLGTALGDWVADTGEMGYVGATAIPDSGSAVGLLFFGSGA